MKTIDFMENADNVYRTKNFIVKQVIVIDRCLDENNSIVSYDTFYKRTKQRDRIFEQLFCDKECINGKRLPSTMTQKKYVD